MVCFVIAVPQVAPPSGTPHRRFHEVVDNDIRIRHRLGDVRDHSVTERLEVEFVFKIPKEEAAAALRTDAECSGAGGLKNSTLSGSVQCEVREADTNRTFCIVSSEAKEVGGQ